MNNFDLLELMENESTRKLVIGVVISLAVFMIYVMIESSIKSRVKMGKLKIASRDAAVGIIFGVIFTLTGPKVVYSPIEEEGSCLVWGTSGSGKTAAILRNTINSISGKGKGKATATTFCIDISGDVECTVTVLKKIVFGPSCDNSAVYYVFYPVDKIRDDPSLSDEEKRAMIIEQLMKIASQLERVLKDGEAEGAVVFFNNGGHDIIGSSLIAGYFTGLDFEEICILIYRNSWKSHFQWIDSCNVPEASALLGQFEDIKDEHVAGCMGNAKSVIGGIASSHKVLQFLRRPKTVNGVTEPFYTPSLLETHSVFYIIDDGTDFDLYASLTRLVVSQTMEYLQSREPNQEVKNPKNHTKKKVLKHMILLALDELSSLNLAQEVASASKKYRKKRVRILALTQSIADLDLMTSRGNTMSRATIDNFPYRLVLGAQDPISQKYFADCVGQHELKSSSKNAGRTIREYWIQPEEFGKLDLHLVLIHPKGHMILGKAYSHKPMMKIVIDSLFDLSFFKWGIH